jgi:hypothetical protein
MQLDGPIPKDRRRLDGVPHHRSRDPAASHGWRCDELGCADMSSIPTMGRTNSVCAERILGLLASIGY